MLSDDVLGEHERSDRGVPASAAAPAWTMEVELRAPLLSPANDNEGGGGPLSPCDEFESSDDDDKSTKTADSSVEKDIALPRCFSFCLRFLHRRRRGDVGDEPEQPPPPLRINHNVALTLLLSFLYGISDGIWGGTVFAAYLKRLGHGRNSPVGDVEAVNGLAGLVSALPVGYLADKIGRAKVIRGGGVLLAATAVLHAYLSAWIGVDDSDGDGRRNADDFWLLGGIMAMWGVAGGIVWGPTQALYADSTPRGSRSKSYTYLFAAGTVSSAVGPLVSIILFQTIGDQWNLYQLRAVMYVGFGLELVNAVIMMFFDDRKALDEPDEPDEDKTKHEESGESVEVCGENVEDAEHVPALSDFEDVSSQIVLRGSSGVSRSDQGNEGEQRHAENQSSPSDGEVAIIRRRRRFIPYIIFLQDIIFAIGSGMTVKFFPLFFKDEVGMSPTQVQVIYVIVPLAMVAFSGLGQTVADTGFGRVQASLALQSAGIALLYSMVFCKRYLDVHPFVLVPVYVLRTALMNCTYPLQESILMDFVPKNERGRWKSLDSISAFGWCGSAAIGGWFSDRYDYTYTFFVTAMLQSVGLLVFALLLPLVPRREDDLADVSGEHNVNGTDRSCGEKSALVSETGDTAVGGGRKSDGDDEDENHLDAQTAGDLKFGIPSLDSS